MMEDEVIAAYNAEMAKNPRATSAAEAGDMVPDLESPAVTEPAAQPTEAASPDSGAP